MWEFCKKLHPHDWLTDNDSTIQKQFWLLSYPIMPVAYFADIQSNMIAYIKTAFYNSESIRLMYPVAQGRCAWTMSEGARRAKDT